MVRSRGLECTEHYEKIMLGSLAIDTDFARNDKTELAGQRSLATTNWQSYIFRSRARREKLGGNYANDYCCSKNEKHSGGGGRFSAARRDRPHRVLRGERQTGGAFLSERTWVSAGCLQRT